MKFYWKKEYENINKQALARWSKKWEKLDDKLFKNKDSKYKMVKFKIRILRTKIGLLIFKRRVYKYHNTDRDKWEYIYIYMFTWQTFRNC